MKLSFVCLALLAFTSARAQDVRATILGRVSDPSGAVIAGARIEITHRATNVRSATNSNEAGNYDVAYLPPGSYQLTVEKPGFKKYVRESIDARVGDRLTVDIRLELGASAESVTVTGEVPLIESASATMGQVVDHKRIVELPLSGGNAVTLVRFTAGAVYTGAPNHPSLLGAVGAINSYIINGAPANSTEYNVDGTSVMTGRWPAFLPPEDMVDEFKIQTAAYNAADGRSSGSAISVSLRSGTNQMHGSLYHYHSDVALQGIDLFQRQQLYNPLTGPVTHEKERQVNPMFIINRPGGSIGGPVRIPRLYNGKNRTFWMYAFEGMMRPTIEAGERFRTVPTAAQRKGDFSALLAIRSAYQVYDPATIAAAPNGRFSRNPFPGNIIPASRLDPTAQKLLSYWPDATLPGTADGLNNFFYPQRSRNRLASNTGRFDHVLSERQRISGRFNYTWGFFTSNLSLPTGANGNDNHRINRSLGLDHVITITPHLVVNTRYNINRHTVQDDPLTKGIDLAGLGFSPNLVKLVPPALSAFPTLSVESMTTLGGDTFGYSATNYHTAGSEAMWSRGSHSIHAGVDFRLFREHFYTYSGATPSLAFGSTWTRGPLDNSTAAPVGQGLASFLLGLPTGGSGVINPSSAEQSWYLGFYVQDDWRVTSKLTLNLGLRYEYESPTTERYNRSLGAFDFSAASPAEGGARVNYAANPIAEISAAQFSAKGGVLFPGVGSQSRGLWASNKRNFSPRAGLAYTFNKDTVLRAGYGIFYLPQGADVAAARQAGFARSTALNPSLDNGLTFTGTLRNPFPDGYLTPLGSAGGLSTNLGNAMSPFNPIQPHSYSQRWSVSVQRTLAKSFLIETSYVGTHIVRMAIGQQADTIPRQYFSTSMERDQRVIDLLSTQVRNPFFPLLPGTGLAGTNVARSQLLRPMPQFTGINIDQPAGYSAYHSFQFRLERRFTSGLAIQTNYTWSKLLEATNFLNEFETSPQKVISAADRPQVFQLTGIYELPTGRGKTFLAGARGWQQHLVGGWQVQATHQAQSGPPIGFGNILFRGNLADLVLPVSDRWVTRWFNTNAGFEKDTAKQLASNVRTFPSRLTGLRAKGLNNWNISASKNFRITEGVRFQFRSEWLNATNHTHMPAPNNAPTSTLFGTIAASTGFPRQIYFVGKLYF
ncbi:MAG: TonB-dependent receptor [Candidatus Solibacter usitatus]|nr:TonB-dependent receptor [Candidatus Solibacter usitatus]